MGQRGIDDPIGGELRDRPGRLGGRAREVRRNLRADLRGRVQLPQRPVSGSRAITSSSRAWRGWLCRSAPGGDRGEPVLAVDERVRAAQRVGRRRRGRQRERLPGLASTAEGVRGIATAQAVGVLAAFADASAGASSPASPPRARRRAPRPSSVSRSIGAH